jgi:hypothetical protein
MHDLVMLKGGRRMPILVDCGEIQRQENRRNGHIIIAVQIF